MELIENDRGAVVEVLGNPAGVYVAGPIGIGVLGEGFFAPHQPDFTGSDTVAAQNRIEIGPGD